MTDNGKVLPSSMTRELPAHINSPTKVIEPFVKERKPMLGWHISIYRQGDGGKTPATDEASTGTRLAVWQARLDGLHWLSELVNSGEAIDFGGNGYPSRYTAMAKYLTPWIASEPPEARPTWVHRPSENISHKWEGKTVIDHATAAGCQPDEWLLVEAWDES